MPETDKAEETQFGWAAVSHFRILPDASRPYSRRRPLWYGVNAGVLALISAKVYDMHVGIGLAKLQTENERSLTAERSPIPAFACKAVKETVKEPTTAKIYGR